MISSRGVAIAVVWLGLGLLAGGGCGKQSMPDAVKDVKLPGNPFLKPDQPITVHPVGEVTLVPGEQKSVLVVVDRNGNEGPIQAKVSDLPTGITATIDSITEADGTAKVAITAAAETTLGDALVEGQANVLVTVGEKDKIRNWKVRVPQVSRPEVSSQQPLVIQPGTTTVWHVPIDRHGFEGEIEFQAKSSSTAITVQDATVPAGEAALKLQVAIAPDAADEEAKCSLQWTSYGRPLSAELPVVIARRPFSLPAVVPVALRRGEKQEKSLAVSRAGYTGPVSLTIGALPEGMLASPAGVVVESDAGAVTLSAKESAGEGVAIVPVHASAGHLLATGLIAVRVLGDTDRAILPGDIVASLPQRVLDGGVDARRAPGARKGLADFYGTTDECGKSVREALRWLASLQAEDGAWRLPAAAGSPAGVHDAVALGGMAVLPFLAEGITHERATVQSLGTEPFAEVVKKTLLYLGKNQPEKGEKVGAIGDTMESHVFGLVAFGEAFALSGDADLKTRATLAVERLIAFQGKKGDWAVTEGNSARDTAWAVVALQAARACGVGAPGAAIRKAAKYLETFQTPDLTPSERFALEADGPAEAELTAACLLAMEYAGRKSDAPELMAGCDYLAGRAPAVGAARAECSPLFLLFAGEALRNIEGERYDAWNAAVRSFLTSKQVMEGEFAGSWDPAIFGGQTDRVWATACATLCLQSHFRYLPLYRTLPKAKQAKPAPDEPDGA